MKIKNFLKEHENEVLLASVCFSLGALWMNRKGNKTIMKAVDTLKYSTEVTNKAVDVAGCSIVSMQKAISEAK